MRYELVKNDILVSESLEKVFHQKIDKIAKRLKRYHSEVANLEIRLNRHEKLNSYECILRLHAFKDSLHAKKSAPELRVAVDKSFDAIMRELDHYRLKINKSLQSSS